jgi:D-alanyl-lipoteichoic acid acyltransferase DltB (MBOAT superfamily)
MLFNSYAYCFAFLPLTWLGYFYLNRLGYLRWATGFLALASLVFYGWWDVRYVPLIVFSMTLNYGLARWLSEREPDGRSRAGLAFGLLFNLGLLALFKYADFIIGNVNAVVPSAHWPLLSLGLPLGISFFTFQKVAYLIDSYRGETKGTPFVHYCLFVLFFPQLIAGPIVHHREALPQFADARRRKPWRLNLVRGLFLFSLGLFKKTVVADSLAPWVHTGFDLLPSLSPLQAWAASLAYSFQLYYDFSGYSDMALGAAALFNIRLPVNFNSPYQSLDILDFWRRWHITLGRFLRDTIYLPLGGNRRGAGRSAANLMLTFLLGGLWHGANWTFIAWGALHGLGQACLRAWRRAFQPRPLPRAMAMALTFLFVHLGWVLFRAKDFGAALKVFKGMLGLGAVGVGSVAAQLGLLNVVIESSIVQTAFASLLLATAGLAACRWRNSQQLARSLKPGWQAVLWTVLLFALGLLNMARTSEFLYFNF